MALNGSSGTSDKRDAEDKFKVCYIKSNFFRVIHVDGVFGGLTPRGLIHADLWSERRPIPTNAAYRVIEGKLGEEIQDERVVRDTDTVREVEAGIVIDVVMAKAIILWLQKQIDNFEELTAQKES